MKEVDVNKVNKSLFKKTKYVDRVSWYMYQRGDSFELRAILIVITAPTIPFALWTANIFCFLVVIISFICLFLTFFIDDFIEEYKEVNHSFYARLSGDDKFKYYSHWYLDNTERECIEYSETLNRYELHYTSKKFGQVYREKDRKHWKNNIPENRILSIKEFIKYKNSKKKAQQLLNQMEYIKEFKEYYELDIKEIDEILK